MTESFFIGDEEGTTDHEADVLDAVLQYLEADEEATKREVDEVLDAEIRAQGPDSRAGSGDHPANPGEDQDEIRAEGPDSRAGSDTGSFGKDSCHPAHPGEAQQEAEEEEEEEAEKQAEKQLLSDPPKPETSNKHIST